MFTIASQMCPSLFPDGCWKKSNKKKYGVGGHLHDGKSVWSPHDKIVDMNAFGWI